MPPLQWRPASLRPAQAAGADRAIVGRRTQRCGEMSGLHVQRKPPQGRRSRLVEAMVTAFNLPDGRSRHPHQFQMAEGHFSSAAVPMMANLRGVRIPWPWRWWAKCRQTGIPRAKRRSTDGCWTAASRRAGWLSREVAYRCYSRQWSWFPTLDRVLRSALACRCIARSAAMLVSEFGEAP